MRVTGLAAAFIFLLCSASAQAQHLGEKRTTASGNVVTVYSIDWLTPVSSVSADVEVCASANASPNTYAFPSYFQVHFADGVLWVAQEAYAGKDLAAAEAMCTRLAGLCSGLRTETGRPSLPRNRSGPKAN